MPAMTPRHRRAEGRTSLLLLVAHQPRQVSLPVLDLVKVPAQVSHCQYGLKRIRRQTLRVPAVFSQHGLRDESE
ncbi:MAG: hypothetical protein ACLQUY_25495 [Ktedonobacterales bacterium]